MSVPSAGKLRELRDRKQKPVTFAITFTLDQLKAIKIAVDYSALTGPPFNESTQALLASVSEHVNKIIPRLAVLDRRKP